MGAGDGTWGAWRAGGCRRVEEPRAFEGDGGAAEAVAEAGRVVCAQRADEVAREVLDGGVAHAQPVAVDLYVVADRLEEVRLAEARRREDRQRVERARLGYDALPALNPVGVPVPIGVQS